MIRDRFVAWRARAAPREQALVALGAVAVLAALGWLLVLAPLARDLAAAEASLHRAKTAHGRALAQAAELARLRGSATPAPADARGAAERVLAQRGLRGQVTSLQAKDGRVEIAFEAIDFAALTALVDALGRDARLFPAEALLAARTTPGSVRAELVLRAAP